MIINAEKNKERTLKYIGTDIKDDFHKRGIVTSIMIINASNDAANKRYIEQKRKFLDNLGVRCYVVNFAECSTMNEIVNFIKTNQSGFTGVMVQSPIYEHLKYDEIIEAIDYKKDIDGLHPMNQGLLCSKSPNAIIPCTALGVIKLLYNHKINLSNQNVVIVGRGKLVADPLSKILEDHDSTVTKIHTKTDPEISKLLIKNADIIISCAGKNLSSMINPSTVGENLKALIGVGFRYESVLGPDDRWPKSIQLQDFNVNDNWNDDIKITSNTNATGLATICALIDNVMQIKYR